MIKRQRHLPVGVHGLLAASTRSSRLPGGASSIVALPENFFTHSRLNAKDGNKKQRVTFDQSQMNSAFTRATCELRLLGINCVCFSLIRYVSMKGQFVFVFAVIR
jgi:hypothetical protein